MQFPLREIGTEHLGPGRQRDVRDDRLSKDPDDIAGILERLRVCHGVVEAPENFAGAGRAGGIVEFPKLRLECLPNTALTPRSEFVADTTGTIPVILRKIGQPLCRPECDQHAEEFRRASCLIQTLCVQPFGTSFPIETAHEITLERRHLAAGSFRNQGVEPFAALGHTTIKFMQFIIPCGLRLNDRCAGTGSPSWAKLELCAPNTAFRRVLFDQGEAGLRSSPSARNSALRAEPVRQASAT